MRGKRRIRLTYANVVASIALFAALGGSSYAAISVTGAQVRDNSLGGRDVRNGSLTGRDLRDQSLLARDFKPGQLPAGPKGDSGPAGPKGDAGSSGAKGEPGLAFLGGGLMSPIGANAGGSTEPVTLEHSTRLLVYGVVTESEFTCAANSPGSCKVQLVPIVDGKAQRTPVAPLVIPAGQTKSFPAGTQLLAVTDEVPAGEHTAGFGITAPGGLYYQYTNFGGKQILAVG